MSQKEKHEQGEEDNLADSSYGFLEILQEGQERQNLAFDGRWVFAADGNVLTDPAEAAANRHCTLRNDRGLFTLIDHGSNEGTLLNGEKVEASKMWPLSYGDEIQWGSTKIRLVEEISQESEEVSKKEKGRWFPSLSKLFTKKA